jgi:hypothetical protein
VAKQVLQFGLINERGSFCGCEPSSLSLLAFEPAGQFFFDAEQKHSHTHIDVTIAQLLAIGVATDAAKPTKARVPPASALESTTPTKTKKPGTSNAAPATPAYMSKYMVGDQISHPMFGNGIVTAIHTNKLTIEFPHSVIK